MGLFQNEIQTFGKPKHDKTTNTKINSLSGYGAIENLMEITH